MNKQTEQNNLDAAHDKAHRSCIVCGYANPKGMHLKFEISEEGYVESSFYCEKNYEGYPGMMHGGVISSILDGAMGNCMFAHGKTTVTIEMKIRFRHPVLVGKKATVWAKLDRVSHPLYLLEAQIVQDGKIKATAEGKYYYQPNPKGRE